jgi:hypothetical protein
MICNLVPSQVDLFQHSRVKLRVSAGAKKGSLYVMAIQHFEQSRCQSRVRAVVEGKANRIRVALLDDVAAERH